MKSRIWTRIVTHVTNSQALNFVQSLRPADRLRGCAATAVTTALCGGEVATMKKGEKANFTLAPEFACAQLAPPAVVDLETC